ncbi:MAG: hypothetical protein AAB664_01790 [Patescibacteria group bacterium]
MSSHDSGIDHSNHDTVTGETEAAPETVVSKSFSSPEEIQRRLDHATRIVRDAQKKQEGITDVKFRIKGILKKLKGAQDDINEVNARIEDLEPKPVSDAMKYGTFRSGEAAGKFFSSSGKNLDHAAMGIEKWADAGMKKNLKWAFDVPVLGWVLGKTLGYKPMKSEIEHEAHEHKKAEAKAKWMEQEQKKVAKLREKKVSEEQIAIIMAEDEEKYDFRVKEKEDKEKEKHGGGHDDHAKKDTKKDAGHGGGGHH